jgi:hypothetical protein
MALAGGLRAQSLPNATLQHGAYAFPDTGGTRLLATADVPQPARLHTALCSGGRRLTVRFERQQAARPDNNGRQSPYSFDKVAGSVFTITQGTIDRDATCFLASDSLVASATLLPVERPGMPTDCSQAARQRVSDGGTQFLRVISDYWYQSAI